MFRLNLLIMLLILQSIGLTAQDSATVKIRQKYNEVGGLHRTFFGENYRKEWSTDTRLPYIKISEVAGGLKPLRMGGGLQTISLRLAAPNGEEWVLRSVVKDPSILLPPPVRQTFAADLLDDAMSAQHPFAPLVVAELAKAANIPHAEPVIGIVQHDPMLGEFNKQFEGKVCLLEQREPFGESDNTEKMLAELDDDNENTVDAREFLRATLFDLLIGDWDRHADQWRWVDTKKGKSKYYVGVPRDRDQAFYVNQGVAPWIASLPWFVPNLQGFSGDISYVKYSLKKQHFLTATPAAQLSEEEWIRLTDEFVKAMTDDVIENALKKLPQSSYELRHNELAAALKKRRDNIPGAMKDFYRFMHKTVDIKLSNKNEFVNIQDSAGNALKIQVSRVKKNGEIAESLMDAVYNPSVTKEIRLFTGKGVDSVIVNNASSPIRLRLVGEEGEKKYNILNADKKIKVYDKPDNTFYSGQTDKLAKHISADTSNTNFIPTNRYNVWMPLIGFGINRDDGFIIGLGAQYTHQGFRKYPYASLNRLMLNYAFATGAFRIRYHGEWLKVIGKADITTNADIRAPENTQNYFGLGNETEFNKEGDFKTYYRPRFQFYQIAAGLRWRLPNNMMFSVGPTFQHYTLDSSDNKGRLIVNTITKTYDSSTIAETKDHLGVYMNFNINKRNSPIIPSKGYYFNVLFQYLGGINDFSKSFGQIVPEFSVYKKLTRNIIIADRIGGGITFGKAAFYQSLFIGGHENLLGYRQYRFAGEHMLYNNLEVRMKIANFTGYIIPGQFGLVGFYDVGRVWVKDEESHVWHNGVGGGLYFAPAQMLIVNVVAGYSNEGWLPYITLGFRF